ncbi:MAG: endolytic transglycosylase MltG [Bacteroidales bacterium]|nr:endolytic transglycosylase MltG [Bacteroidales bacterium]
MKKKRKISIKRILLLMFFIIAVYVVILVLQYSYYGFVNNVKIKKDYMYIYIPTGSKYEDVLRILTENNILDNIRTFELLAELKNYKNNVKPGRYRINKKMSTNKIINILRAGLQEPVSLYIGNFYNLRYFSRYISKHLEIDSTELLCTLQNEEIIGKYGFNKNNILALFLNDTYSIYWNTSIDKFLDRMYSEYQKYWDNEKIKKLNKLGISAIDAIIIASIVQFETNHYDEMPRIAGVYYNRLKKGMLLQADPTIKYAWNNFSLKRITKEHLSIASPYNTYLFRGLPPGPICIPNKKVIEAVLNLEFHNFLYFCAKTDGSGYHVFSKSYDEHLRYAKLYHKKLNELGIY